MESNCLPIGIARTHFPITALGYGRRIGVWVQGCSIRCDGCMSVDTWRPSDKPVSVSAIVNTLRINVSDCDGLTISGGEPFDQPRAMLQLLRAIRPQLSGDILLFTGYEFGALPSEAHPCLAYIDLLVAGPFDPSKACAATLRGSSNQTVHALTGLGGTRFEALSNASARPMDVITDETGLWLAGIPAPGDLDRFSDVLKTADLVATTSVGRLGRKI